MAQVRIDSLCKSYGAAEILRDISLETQDGEFVVLVGPSGCGKSTLLRLIAGLDVASSGYIHIGARNVSALPPAARKIAMVFQSYALYPHKNVRDNMTFGLKFSGMARAEMQRRVSEAARMLQLKRCWRESRAIFPAGSASASPLAAPSCASPKCFCLTSRCPIWTRRCACQRASRLPGCTASCARR